MVAIAGAVFECGTVLKEWERMKVISFHCIYIETIVQQDVAGFKLLLKYWVVPITAAEWWCGFSCLLHRIKDKR